MSSVFRFSKPSSDQLIEIANEQSRHTVTYDEVGATASGDLPDGYAIDRHSVDVGRGGDVFDDAVRLLKAWGPPRFAGFAVEATGPITTGTIVAMAAPLPVGAAIACCRIVDVCDEHDKFAFSYGTLPLHPEKGEERFTIVRTDDLVRFEILAFSRPVHPLARIGRPITRRVQQMITAKYLLSFTSGSRRQYP